MQRGMPTDTYRVCHSSLRTPPATRRNFHAESYENFIMNRRARGDDTYMGLDYGTGKTHERRTAVTVRRQKRRVKLLRRRRRSVGGGRLLLFVLSSFPSLQEEQWRIGLLVFRESGRTKDRERPNIRDMIFFMGISFVTKRLRS